MVRRYYQKQISYILDINKGTALSSSLSTKLTQINAYAKCFDENSKCINLLIKDEEIFKKYNEILNKIASLLKKIDSKPGYNNKYIETEIEI